MKNATGSRHVFDLFPEMLSGMLLPNPDSLLPGNLAGNLSEIALLRHLLRQIVYLFQWLGSKFPDKAN
jgi:hypothetical protein